MAVVREAEKVLKECGVKTVVCLPFPMGDNFKYPKEFEWRDKMCIRDRLYPGLPVLCSGGVASNSILRAFLYDAGFAAPEFSTDNAMGIAVLAERRLRRGE